MTAPTTWELIVAIAGAGSFMALLITCGIVYGKVMARLDALEKSHAASIPRSEVALMLEDIKGQLRRIETEVVSARSREHT